VTGAGARRKGFAWEREIARRLREATGNADIKRGFQSRNGGEAPDVDLAGWWIEAKVGRKPNLRAALAQAIAAAPPDRKPVAIVKDDRQEPVVMLRLTDFLAVIALLSPHSAGEVHDRA
jgi:hypothetical protein